jgi:hypothetical protein
MEKIAKTSRAEPLEFKYGVLNQIKQQIMAIQMIYERIAFNIQKKISQGSIAASSINLNE